MTTVQLRSTDKVSGIFLDINKAFYMVDYEILLDKRNKRGVRGNTYSFNSIVNYFTKRKRNVKINKTKNEFGNITSDAL